MKYTPRVRRLAPLLGLLVAGCLQPAPVTFELENATGAERFVQARDVNADRPAWLRIFDEGRVPLRHSGAGMCACGCDQGFDCQVECEAIVPEVDALPAGGVVSFDWDGLERRFTGDCVQTLPVAGARLSVEACAAEQAVADPQSEGRIVADATLRCRRVDFARGAGTVRVVLE